MRYLTAFVITACLSTAITLTVLITKAVKDNGPTVAAVAEDARYEAHWKFMGACVRKNSLKDCQNAK